MKIVLAAFGTRGDVQPMVALGMRLRADGHHVVVGASQGFAGFVRGHGLEFQTIGLDIEAWIRSHGELVARPARIFGPAMRYLREEIALSFEQTHAAAGGADLLLSGIHVAAPSVADALALPYRTLLFCPQMLRSRHHPAPFFPWLHQARFVHQATWWASSKLFDQALGGEINRARRSLRQGPIDDVLSYLVGDRTIVASDALLGELPSDASPTIVQTGSLSLPVTETLDPALERFLANGERPVYVGFGSMPDHDARRTTRMILDALEACRCRGVVDSGWAGLGEEALPASAFAVRSVPHALLFPRVAIAVHHGGAGTTAAAARAGVPQIVVPHFVDQHYWGQRIHRLGLGTRPITRSSLTAERLSRAIKVVRSHPGITKRARALKAGLDRSDGVTTLSEILYEIAEHGSARRVAA